MIHCLNSHGCNKEVPPGQVFCSERCRLVYRGEAKPDYSNYKPYTGPDKEFKKIDVIFQKYFGYHQKPKKKRGVKTGTKRGRYNKPKVERKIKNQLTRLKKQQQRERVRRHRQQKKEQLLKRKREVLSHV